MPGTASARGEATDAVHALDYLAYAYLQTAQPEAALARRRGWESILA